MTREHARRAAPATSHVYGEESTGGRISYTRVRCALQVYPQLLTSCVVTVCLVSGNDNS